MCVHCFGSHPTPFPCSEYEENGEIKKETKYSYSKLIYRKSLFFYVCNFGLLCVCILIFVVNPVFSCWEGKECEEISKNSVS